MIFNQLKMLYHAMIDITKKWTSHRKDWGLIHFSWKYSSQTDFLNSRNGWAVKGKCTADKRPPLTYPAVSANMHPREDSRHPAYPPQ